MSKTYFDSNQIGASVGERSLNPANYFYGRVRKQHSEHIIKYCKENNLMNSEFFMEWTM